MTPSLALLAAAMRAYDSTTKRCRRCGATWDAEEGEWCRWCTNRRQADAEYVLKPPAPRGYGYATDDDLKRLGYDPELDRQRDLKRWAHDMDLAVEAGLITNQQGQAAWESANKKSNPNASTSSTGTTSTTTPTQTKTPSSTASPTADVGQQSQAQRKRGNRRSSSPWQFRPHKQDTK